MCGDILIWFAAIAIIKLALFKYAIKYFLFLKKNKTIFIEYF